ncbi:type 2 periplasmic-binding domain-containing protein [Glycomyces tarimensis]
MKPAAAVLAAALLALTACTTGGRDEPSGALHVFAAASLTEAFGRIATDFEDADPGIDVVLNFAGSASLAAQIDEGAPADVFASAAPTNMDEVIQEGHAEDPEVFARNELTIAVAEGNPLGIDSPDDLADPEVKVAVCAEAVPCGAAARTAIEAAGVDLTPVTYESDVKAALAKLALGEVDAALVYRTDVKAASGGVDGVDGVDFPESATAVNDYSIAVLDDAPNPSAAAAFAEYVRSDEALAVLTAAGFQAP